MEPEAEFDRLEKSLQRMLDWIKAIDTKTQLVLGLNVAMLGGLVAVTPQPDDVGLKVLAVLTLGGVLPLLSSIQCVRGFFPQIKGPGDSLIFFAAIENRTLHGFQEASSKQTDDGYRADLSEQVYRNAQIASAKYRFVKSAILLQAIGLVPWLIACFILYKGL